MKTTISRFLLLGAALTVLTLSSACSQQNASAQSQAIATPVVTNPPAPVVPENSVVPAKPATMPASIQPTSPLAQVVRLAQAGVDESIIMVYVTNSSRTFNLDSDKIIYLTDLGLPTDVITSMMQRDQQLQQEFAAAQAEQQAQQLQQSQPTQQVQNVSESDTANTADAVTPPAPVSTGYFYDTLSPYGSWVVINGYGSCWRPAVCAYNPSWQPYCDRGHWVYTDCGWYWSSDYAWGATFHYGRWFRDASLGWCWYPNTVWAPSWVTWRYSNNYCGWAPLPPGTYCQSGIGIVYQGGGVSLGFSFGLGASCFTFVPTQYFCNPHPRNYCVPPSQVAQVYNNTTVINNIRIHGSGNNQIIVNSGIPAQSVANVTQRPIRPVPVHQIDAAFAHRGSDQLTDRPSRVFVADRPNVTGNISSPAMSSATAHAESSASTTAQYPPRSIVISGNGSRPTQNHFAPPLNNQNTPVEPGQNASAQIHSQPEHNNPTLPQRPAPLVNYHSQPYQAPANWVQPGIPHNYSRVPEVQNAVSQNRAAAPAANYSAPVQPQMRSYSQPRQNYSPAPVVSVPHQSAPGVAAAPSQGGGRGSNQNWPGH